MGTNCAPFLADLVFFQYELEFRQIFVKTRWSKKLIHFTYRYIVDVLSISNSNMRRSHDRKHLSWRPNHSRSLKFMWFHQFLLTIGYIALTCLFLLNLWDLSIINYFGLNLQSYINQCLCKYYKNKSDVYIYGEEKTTTTANLPLPQEEKRKNRKYPWYELWIITIQQWTVLRKGILSMYMNILLYISGSENITQLAIKKEEAFQFLWPHEYRREYDEECNQKMYYVGPKEPGDQH